MELVFFVFCDYVDFPFDKFLSSLRTVPPKEDSLTPSFRDDSFFGRNSPDAQVLSPTPGLDFSGSLNRVCLFLDVLVFSFHEGPQ